jgi:hypothetical protein
MRVAKARLLPPWEWPEILVGSILTPDCGKVSKEEIKFRKADGVVPLASGLNPLGSGSGLFAVLKALRHAKAFLFRDGATNSRFLTGLSARFGMTIGRAWPTLIPSGQLARRRISA